MENRGLRVIHLINNLEREGAQTVVFNLVTAASGGAAQHVVCVRQPGGPLEGPLKDHGIPVFAPRRYYGALGFRRSLKFIEWVIDNQSIDIIHAHMADAAFLGWLAAMKSTLPLVITHHGYDIVPRCGFACSAAHTIVLAVAARYAIRNVAVSAVVEDRLRRVIRLNADRVDVIVNGVPVSADDEVTYRNTVESPRVCVVTVGRLVELKGHSQLIAAAAVLVRRYPDARFVIVGDGPLRERLEQNVNSQGLSGSFLFTGSIDDVPAYLREADLYVSTSHYEGMPIATLEAMALGVPVVVSEVPGNRGLVQHGETGLMYRLDDIDGLVQAIIEVIDQPARARERARDARRMVRERYSIDAAVHAYERLYAEVSASATWQSRIRGKSNQ